MLELILQRLLQLPSNAPVVSVGEDTIPCEVFISVMHAVLDALKEARVPRGAVVGVRSVDGWKWIGALMALWQHGAVFQPAPPGIVDEPFIPNWWLDIDHTSGAIGLIPAGGADEPMPSDAGYVVPTSGSTGKPKWIIGNIKGVEEFVRWEVDTLSVTSTDVVAQLTPPTFDPYLRDVFVALCTGARIAIPARRENVAAPAALLEWMDTVGVTIIHTIPTFSRLWTRYATTPGTLSQVRAVLLAGEPLFQDDVDAWRAAFGSRAELLNLYGPSETVLATCAHRISQLAEPDGRIPVGFPIGDRRVIVVDEDMQPCAPYSDGEILIRSDTAGFGYWQDSERTKTTFISNPLAPEHNVRVFRTGDLGHCRSDGRLVVVGRRDAIVKFRGQRLDLCELERLIAAVEGVDDAAVNIYKPPDGLPVLVAYVVTRLPLDMVRRHVGQHIAGRAAPQVWTALTALPRTHTGKLDRSGLPSPHFSSFGDVATSLKERMLQLWREVLPYSGAITSSDSFASLGGESIEAIQLVLRIEREFKVSLSLADFYELGTINALIEALAANPHDKPSDAPALSPIIHQSDHTAPLTGAQLRFWRWIDRAPAVPRFQFAWSARIRNVDIERLRSTLGRVMTAATAQSVDFELRDGEIYQTFVDLPLTFTEADCRGLPDSDIEVTVRAFCGAPFQLGRERLMRVLVAQIDQRSHLLVLNNHVLASDGRTRAVLLRDIQDAYSDPQAFAPPATTFFDCARWEQTARIHWPQYLDFWRKTVDVAVMDLPYRDHNEDSNAAMLQNITLDLPESITRGVARRAKELKVTVASVHLTAVTRLLASWLSRPGHLLISTAKRHDPLMNRVVGCFTDSMLFPVNIERPHGFGPDVQQTHALSAACLQNAVPSFIYTVEHLWPKADPLDSYMFPVIFAPQPDLSAEFRLEGGEVEIVPMTPRISIWPLEIYPVVADSFTRLSINYSDGLFARETIEQFVASYADHLALFCEERIYGCR